MATFENDDQVKQQQPQQQRTIKVTSTDVPNLSELLSTVGSLSPLSKRGHEYFEAIKAAMLKPENQRVLPINITTLNSPQDALALECDGKVVILIPKEVLPSNTNDVFPSSVAFQSAVNSYFSISGKTDHKILEIILVIPEDYEYVEKMIRGLLNIFQVVHNPKFGSFNIQSMRSSKFAISTNYKDVADFLDRTYPHKCIPRNDFGFVLYELSNNRSEREIYQNMESSVVRTPIACVTGYVEPMQINQQYQGGMTKFLPLVHITNIQSLIPDIRLCAALIPLASDIFLKGGLWRTQFEQYSKDAPNIGALFRNRETGQPDFVENYTRLQEVLNTFFEPPALAIDVVDGVYRIPGIEKFSIPNASAEVNKLFFDFIGQTPTVAEQSIVFATPRFQEFIGTVMYKSKIGDSRWCDYLNTIVHHSSELGYVAGMLQRSIDPKVRVEQIRRFYGSFEVLFSNMVCEISLQAIMAMQEAVRSCVQIITSTLTPNANVVDLSSFLQQGHMFAQGNPYTLGWGQNNTINYGNPIANIYR
jgi:hypothetical protein